LRGYYAEEDDAQLPPPVADDVADRILDKIAAAKRPVIYAGYGIRLSGGFEVFRRVLERLGVPIAIYWNSVV